ncbi:MAG TPA: hypothetical protein PLR83_05885 [Pyrinomonadaceae bacterium]|nr:hypothetical protein [Pyrinomonadaceae bacterium]
MSRFLRSLTFAAALITLPVFASAQKTHPPMPPVTKIPKAPPAAITVPQEKALLVNSEVNLTLCVLRGKLSVNSWSRNEVRVYTAEGSKFEFKVLQKDAAGTPVWVSVNATSQRANPTLPPSDCLDEDDIEIDAPAGTTLSVKGREVALSVSSINTVAVSTFGGDTQLRNIADGVSALVNRGNISIEDSSGAISVESTTGNILVFGVKPKKPGDIFRAKTLSGNIAIVDTNHRQIDAGTISGAISYTGPILNGGAYRFSSQNGNLRLDLPKDSSATVAATYGFGSFSSGFQLEVATENITEESIKSIVGKIGKPSDAVIKLITMSGRIEFQPVDEGKGPKN